MAMHIKYIDVIRKNSLLLFFLIISLFIIGCSANSSDSTVIEQGASIGESCKTFSDCKIPLACNFDTSQCEDGSVTKCFDTIDCKYAGTYCKLSDKFEYDEKTDFESYVGNCEKGCDEDYDCAAGKACDLGSNFCQ